MTVKDARKKAGFTQIELAEKIGVAQQQLARWETGGRNPKLDALRKIATACGVPLDDLI